MHGGVLENIYIWILLMSADLYSHQDRGDSSAYDTYFAAMDQTMRQKLSFTAAHFLLKPGAIVADMGPGSGTGTLQFAQLNPHVNVVGIDINPTTVSILRERHRLPNLRFEVGDAEHPDPALGPFDGVLNSSVLHHVLSFNGYDPAHVANALKNQFACMRPGGINVIRDFYGWPADRFVLLDVSTANKGRGGKTPVSMSDANLLRLFSETARPLAPELGPGFFLEEATGAPKGRQRFRLSAKWANEFLLRKDYHRNWAVEVQEEYSWWTPKEYRRELAALDARVIYMAPFWNDWIIKNRYQEQVALWDESGQSLAFPPTNFIVVAEKIEPNNSARVSEHTTRPARGSYLRSSSWIHKGTKEVYDIVSRPGDVVDCLPYVQENGRLFVYAKHGYPRPIANTIPRGTPNLDGKIWSGHMVEPIAVAASEQASDLIPVLAERSGLSPERLAQAHSGLSYYTSPGMVDEKVASIFIPVAADDIAAEFKHDRPLPSTQSAFSTAGEVRLYPAQDLLRAAQVGMLPGARLELNIYGLMLDLGIKPDAWLGTDIPHPDKGVADTNTLAEWIKRPARQVYESSTQERGYLRHIRSVFADIAKDRRHLVHAELEFVLPASGTNVASVIPLACNSSGEVCVGLEERDLPSPQLRDGNSCLLVTPAYRLPNTVDTLDRAAADVAARMGQNVSDVFKLGESYFSSIGITPERVFPFAVRIDPLTLKEPLHFVRLSELIENRRMVRDAHLLIIAMRAAHALGEWPALHPSLPSRSTPSQPFNL